MSQEEIRAQSPRVAEEGWHKGDVAVFDGVYFVYGNPFYTDGRGPGVRVKYARWPNFVYGDPFHFEFRGPGAQAAHAPGRDFAYGNPF